MDDNDEWSELDQHSVRKSIREVITSMPGDSWEDHVTALRQLREMVANEIASGLSGTLNYMLMHRRPTNLVDARFQADRMTRDLESLKLAVRHPHKDEVMRLTLAKTPPANEHQSWFQLEPYRPSPGDVPMRLTHPLPELRLCDAPSPYAAARTPPRG